VPKCKDCGTTYRNMDHSVYDCAMAGGKEAQRMMAPRACGNENGGLRCELPPGHDGKHGEVMSRDEEGRVDDAVVWA